MSREDLQDLLRKLLDYEEHRSAAGGGVPRGLDHLMMEIDTEINFGKAPASPTPMLNDMFANMSPAVGDDGVFDPFGLA